MEESPGRLWRLVKFFIAIWRPFAICAVSGIALALAYPAWDVSALVWFALAPALTSLWLLIPFSGKTRVIAAALCGWIAGCSFFLMNLFWMTEVSYIGWIVVSLYLGLYFAAWAVMASTVGRPRFSLYALRVGDHVPQSWTARMFASSADSLRVGVANASTWTALEWVRSWMFTGFGWNGLGAALYENHVLIQICDIVGVNGLSFFVMLALSVGTTTVYRIVLEIRHARIRPHADFFAVLAVFMGLFFYGTYRIREVSQREKSQDAHTLQCLVIQPNISQDIKWEELYAYDILEELYDATAAGVLPDLDLVIWPETAVPFSLQSLVSEEFITRVFKLGDFTLISGFNDIQLETEFYNALAMFHGSYRKYSVYRKNHLVPFGEYIPLRNSFPPFEWIAGDKVTGDFSRGTDSSPLPLSSRDDSSPYAEIIPLICFEDTIGELARQFLSKHPQLMVTVTNNGWFYESANSRQHLANAKFRCVELRLPMLRSANTGVTCYIGPTGNIHSHVHDPDTGSTFINGALLAQVKLHSNSSPTFFAKHGDLFSQIMASGSLILALLYFKSRWKTWKTPPKDSNLRSAESSAN